MNTDLTQDQIDSYRQNGFVVLHDFLTPEELETWRQAVDGAVRQRGKQKMFNQEVDEDQEETYYDYVFVQRINLWQDSLDVRRLILDPRLGRMASDLAGVEGVRIWHDQALIKQPWANPTGWHLDNPYWSYSSRKTLSLWVALDDATLQNGCLYFLPGSHKTATYDNAAHRRKHRRHLPRLPAVEGHHGVPRRDEGRFRLLSQRTHRPRRRRQHDPGLAAGHDLRIHAGRLHLQRHTEHPSMMNSSPATRLATCSTTTGRTPSSSIAPEPYEEKLDERFAQ